MLVKLEVTAVLPGNRVMLPIVAVIEPLITGLACVSTAKLLTAMDTLESARKSPMVIPLVTGMVKLPRLKPVWVRVNVGRVNAGNPENRLAVTLTLVALRIVLCPGVRSALPTLIVRASPRAISRLAICTFMSPGDVVLPKSKLPVNDPSVTSSSGTPGKRAALLAAKEIVPLTEGVAPYCRAKLFTSTSTLLKLRRLGPIITDPGLVQLRLPNEKPSCWIV